MGAPGPVWRGRPSQNQSSKSKKPSNWTALTAADGVVVERASECQEVCDIPGQNSLYDFCTPLFTPATSLLCASPAPLTSRESWRKAAETTDGQPDSSKVTRPPPDRFKR